MTSSLLHIKTRVNVSLGAEDQPISATAKQRIDLDDKLLRSLAENIGKDWKRLGTELGFKAAEIEALEYNCKNDLKEQAFQMFVVWIRKQTNDNEARDKLAEALDTIGRADMASGKMTKYLISCSYSIYFRDVVAILAEIYHLTVILLIKHLIYYRCNRWFIRRRRL